MHTLLLGWLLLGPPGTPAKAELAYGFATKDYIIEMKVRFPAPYRGKRLVFYNSLDPKRAVCYSADGAASARCIEQFVGAVALVTYAVKLPNGDPPEAAAIRELVTVTAQSPGLDERAPVSKTQTLIQGMGSDIQVFGYEESALRKVRASRQQVKALWRLYRQELYLNADPKPFAIIEWKHTLDAIRIAEIYAPPD